MGRVWRAHHTALKRDDALKVLPDAFAADPERLAAPACKAIFHTPLSAKSGCPLESRSRGEKVAGRAQ